MFADRPDRRAVSVAGSALLTAGMLLTFFFACSSPTAPLPEGATPFQAPLTYQVWWRQVQSCSQRVAPFEAVDWYVVPETFTFEWRGRLVVGVWTGSGNRIILGEHISQNAMVVRHEMLHAILRTGQHPPEYFLQRCLGWVDPSF